VVDFLLLLLKRLVLLLKIKILTGQILINQIIKNLVD